MHLNRKGLWKGLIREFREFLPEVSDDAVTTFREGNTPLIESYNLGDIFGIINSAD